MKKFIFGLFLCMVMFSAATPALAIPCEPGKPITDQRLCNPVEREGGLDGEKTPAATNIVELVTKFLFTFAGFATLIPVVAVTYAGFSMVIAQGNEEAITRAKSGLQWAVVGFIMAIMSYFMVAATIQFIGAGNAGDPLEDKATLRNPLAYDDPKLNPDLFLPFVFNLVENLLKVAGAVAILFLIIAGIRYIASAGNEEQATQAKKSLMWIVIGVVVILLSYVIISAADNFFRTQ